MQQLLFLRRPICSGGHRESSANLRHTIHGMATSQGDPAAILDPKDYAVVWIAPLEIEAKAALYMLDEQHQGRFAVDHGDEYVFHAGSMCGHNVVIATFPAGQEYGTGSAAALASQILKCFPHHWFGLLVGVAAGLPDLSCNPPRDIRLGDVLVSLPEGERAGIIAYDLGKETDDGFQPLRYGHVLTTTKPIVRSAIGRIKIQAPNDAAIFLPYYEKIRDREHANGTFTDPGQDRDRLYSTNEGRPDELVERVQRPDSARTRVWYGPIGSGDKLLKNAQRRNELRDKYGVIGLEMEAAGTMNRIPVGVIRGVCDYGDQQKNKEWQPYAAAMAAAYAKAVLREISPAKSGIGKTQIALRFAYDIKESRPDYSIFWVPVLSHSSVEQAYVEIARKLGVQKKTDDEDINSDKGGKWLLVIDNADDQELFFGSDDKAGIEEYIPESENGLILLTTRSRQVAVQFTQSNIVDIEEMDSNEATLLLQKSLTQRQTPQDEALVEDLLIQLTYLPLAITQAVAYLNQTKVLKSDPIAIDLLSFTAYIEPKAIPQWIMPGSESEETEWAIGILCGFSFLVRRGDDDIFDMHSLVHLATREWLKTQGRHERVAYDAIRRFNDIFPSNDRENLAVERETLDEKDHDRLTSEHELARAYLNNRRIKEVIEMFEYVVAVQRETLDEKDHSRLASEHELARAYLQDQRIEKAIEMFEHVVAMRRETLDEKDHSRLASEHMLAGAYLKDRRIKEAIEMLEYVVATRGETLDEKDHSRLASEHMLASAYLEDRRIKEAIEMLEHVVAVEAQIYAEDDPERVLSAELLAETYATRIV
ncbi:uncharacterized protein B0I36DRAFT_436186 [Microdochium trichocladiopsis]|uniref:Nucleoside phosphorylase domain-containing protein n=1 Tax=Microdochium trichocladiopsis TaxID=1682393 RepID=A0A9P9BGY8_9PEZI|nr:uncharacterized protein B0I36DRAFT_436186 [Microdochium trichocladiopsis]KAH7016552.1 hypothetical protein B0I36DRAFT_436186 [Microdochium trichocladiopsis]